MGKNKKIRKGIESLKQQIEIHFQKLEKDLERNDLYHASYHAKELNRSLIIKLEEKFKILGNEDEEIVEEYRERLKKLMEWFE